MSVGCDFLRQICSICKEWNVMLVNADVNVQWLLTITTIAVLFKFIHYKPQPLINICISMGGSWIA